MGVAPEVARSALRVSLGRTTTEDDISRFVAAYRQLTSELKNLTAMAVEVH
jgi:cysteine desulfurase